MRQRVFTALSFGSPDIAQAAFDGIDRIVLRGDAILAFHIGLGEIFTAPDKDGNLLEVRPEDVEEIQGTKTLRNTKPALGNVFGYDWDYIQKEP